MTTKEAFDKIEQAYSCGYIAVQEVYERCASKTKSYVNLITQYRELREIPSDELAKAVDLLISIAPAKEPIQ
ncbi:MAG: hypothetical protein ABIG61_12235 [Planctomycetota bacterium]